MHEGLTGEKCCVCGNPFFEGDDVVVCPECGAPYHRECYRRSGKCEFADRHGEYEWQSEKEQMKEHYENIEQAEIDKRDNASQRKNSTDDIFENLDLTEIHSAEEYQKYLEKRLLEQESDFPDVEGVTAQDFMFYIGKNILYYFPTFAQFAKKKRLVRLNLASWFFFPAHCFYRRMNFLGVLSAFLYIGLSEVSLLLSKYISLDGGDISFVTVLGFLLANAVIALLMFFFNFLYFKTAVKRIKRIKEKCKDKGEAYIAGMISEQGRPSLFNSVAFTVCVILAGIILVKLLNNCLPVASL